MFLISAQDVPAEGGFIKTNAMAMCLSLKKLIPGSMSEKGRLMYCKSGANLLLEPLNSLGKGSESNGNMSSGNKTARWKQDRKVKKRKRDRNTQR